MLSIPILAVWVFGTQFLILFYLIKNRRKLNSTAVKKYFHVIYIGYREERFYWEFVNTFKKFILIAYNVFLSQVSKSYKGMIAIITLIILVRLQMFQRPYKLKVNNEVENSSMVAIGFTLYGGLLFMKGQSQVAFVEAITFIFIIIINSVYIMFWIYLMSKTYDKHEVAKKIVVLLKIVLLRGDNDTVLTGTNEAISDQNMEHIIPAPIIRKNGKAVKHHHKKTIKYNPLKEESTSSFFRNKVKSSENRELFKMQKKSKKKGENTLKEHDEFWVKINQNFEESKMGSFDMVDIMHKNNASDLLIKEENKEDESKKEISLSIHHPQKSKIKDHKRTIHLIKL